MDETVISPFSPVPGASPNAESFSTGVFPAINKEIPNTDFLPLDRHGSEQSSQAQQTYLQPPQLPLLLQQPSLSPPPSPPQLQLQLQPQSNTTKKRRRHRRWPLVGRLFGRKKNSTENLNIPNHQSRIVTTEYNSSNSNIVQHGGHGGINVIEAVNSSNAQPAIQEGEAMPNPPTFVSDGGESSSALSSYRSSLTGDPKASPSPFHRAPSSSLPEVTDGASFHHSHQRRDSSGPLKDSGAVVEEVDINDEDEVSAPIMTTIMTSNGHCQALVVPPKAPPQSRGPQQSHEPKQPKSILKKPTSIQMTPPTLNKNTITPRVSSFLPTTTGPRAHPLTRLPVSVSNQQHRSMLRPSLDRIGPYVHYSSQDVTIQPDYIPGIQSNVYDSRGGERPQGMVDSYPAGADDCETNMQQQEQQSMTPFNVRANNLSMQYQPNPYSSDLSPQQQQCLSDQQNSVVDSMSNSNHSATTMRRERAAYIYSSNGHNYNDLFGAPKYQNQSQGQNHRQRDGRKEVKFMDIVEFIPAHRNAEYNRRADENATFKKLTTAMKSEIKDELNSYKMKEMMVHVQSMGNTAFH